MSRPLARYTPGRLYLSLMLFAFCGVVLSAWIGLRWAPSWIAAVLFALSAVALSLVTLRPAIEIHESHLVIGRMAIPWREIERIDQTGWNAPLAVYLTVRGGHRIMLLYPGDPESSDSLLGHLRRFSRHALLDGIPYRQFWGEPASRALESEEAESNVPARYPLLQPEDEEEVERMFQRLKSVGHLESKNSEEK